MCTIYADQDPASYEPITRAIRMAGAATSLRLEAAFWLLLDELAAEQNITTSRFINKLHSEVLQRHGKVTNFASLLRVSCLLYSKGQAFQLPVYTASRKAKAA